MARFSLAKERASSPAEPESSSTPAFAEASKSGTRERDAPPPRSPHIDRLRGRKDGPYYVAPDSVEPLPSGMWSHLDIRTVEAEAAHFPSPDLSIDVGTTDSPTRNAVPERHREFLQAGGVAANRLLTELERGL
jgi:hypothetical protein